MVIECFNVFHIGFVFGLNFSFDSIFEFIFEGVFNEGYKFFCSKECVDPDSDEGISHVLQIFDFLIWKTV